MANAKYRVYCETEADYVLTEFREGPPDECPHNAEHVIDEDKTALVEWEPIT